MEKMIDLVYLWVDDKDEAWLKKKNLYFENIEILEDDAINDCRFHNNDELKYSLRSVEKYANWINKIFIITDRQVPEWLDITNPRIKIVDHSEIIPMDKLPLFNSCAIETRIPFIEGLSEYFLYANDDTFFWNKVDKNFFYKNNKPIIRALKFLKRNKVYQGYYSKTIIEAYKKIENKYAPNFCIFLPHHNIDSYKKSTFINCINKYKNDFEEILNHRFRQEGDIQRVMISNFALVNNEAVLKIVKKNFLEKLFNIQSDSFLYNLKGKNISRLKNINTKLMCINDNERATLKDRENLKLILEEKFKEKCCFEK